MMARRFDLICFDWDGTLFDSTDVIARCIQKSAHDLGLHVPERKKAAHVIGMALPDALKWVLPDLSAARYGELIARYRFHYYRQQNALSLFDGGVDMLKDLHARHYWLAVATGKGRQGLDAVLKRKELQGLFDDSRTADETAGKPSPRMLLELMQVFGVEPERCLMIGDTTHDLQMARNAGCPSVAVAYGAHTPDLLEPLQPLYLAASLPQLHDWLLQNA